MGNSKKMKFIFKLLLVLVLVAVLVFGAFNIAWLIFFNKHIKPFRNKIDYDDMTRQYVYVDADQYAYSISYYYLRFDAELTISEIQSNDNPVQSRMSITVSSDGYEYDAVVNYQNDEKDEFGNNNYDSYFFHLNKDIQLVDSNGNVIESPSDEEKVQYDKAYPELKILFDKAYTKWNDLKS